ncbi:hypothetical protein [Achromobacter sp. MFA1 R4]|uniref:hypothetical protein n=1 Tax=Achromobacter sp. MFA1 R4 TaxID=1881016 RepID=UPI0009537D43|nr:hypothetical protein [Achromobacter sp. MFA1 R4]SIT04822.1 hypothetical protein SAMN05428937_0409 [Achromobacter sp. MFA1 R4]
MLESGTTIPACLDSLLNVQRQWVNDQLCNNDVSSDEEMSQFLQAEVGLNTDQVKSVMAYRDSALADPFFQLFPFEKVTEFAGCAARIGEPVSKGLFRVEVGHRIWVDAAAEDAERAREVVQAAGYAVRSVRVAV